VPEEADWQRRARLAADALAEAKADAQAKGHYPAHRGRARPTRGGLAPASPPEAPGAGVPGGGVPGTGVPRAGGSAAPSADGVPGEGPVGAAGKAAVSGEAAVSGGPAVPGQPVVPGRQGLRGPATVPGPRRRRGGRTRREDPQPLATALDGLLGDQGWRMAAAVGSVFGRWDQLVGADVAAHTKPERFNDGELVVIADSAAWATQVRLLTSAVLRRLNEELGHGTVTRVVVRGPAPPRRMGPLRVRGTREHNDDYG
jgi:predicted nucleic acid-binding Zn ribbon protein